MMLAILRIKQLSLEVVLMNGKTEKAKPDYENNSHEK